MLIKSIYFEEHSVLKGLTLDFTDGMNSTPFTTVVLAGENGTGKTVILNEIYSMFGEVNPGDPGRIVIEVEVSDQDVEEMRDKLSAPTMTVKDRLLTFRRTGASPGYWTNLEVDFQTNTGSINQGAAMYFSGPGFRPFRAFLSEAAVGFKTGPRDAIRATTLDPGVPARRGGPEIADQIAQLIIDIRAADNEDLRQWVTENPGQYPNEKALDMRMGRFKAALNYMFPTKRFKTSQSVNGRHEIMFEENGRPSTLDQLSTGEKQILFRGGFILRDLAAIQGSIVLIDEPELSLHPTWQAKIAGFYRHLIPHEARATTQLIIATHSPFVVHDQEANTKVVILSKNVTNGDITVDPIPAYPTTGHARIVQALNVDALIARAESEVILLVEGESDQTIIKAAWSKLYPDLVRYFDVRPALSDTAVRSILNNARTFVKNPDKKIVGLFDFDLSYDQWKGVWKNNGQNVVTDPACGLTRKRTSGHGWSMLLPVPSFRTHIAGPNLESNSALSIEMMFEDRDHIPGLVSFQPLPFPGATKPKVNDAMKVAFAAHAASLSRASFDAFKPLFARLDDIRFGRL